MKILFLSIIVIFSISGFAQKKETRSSSRNDKARIREYFERLENQADFIAKCEEQIRQSQIKNFGKVLPKIAGECEWGNNGCPVSIVKPKFPNSARNLKLSRRVEVEIIVDEKGQVIYAKAVKGSSIFYANAEKAANLSRFYPKTFCGKAVMQKRFIVYNFSL